MQIGVANCENEDTPGNIILPKHIGYLTILEGWTVGEPLETIHFTQNGKLLIQANFINNSSIPPFYKIWRENFVFLFSFLTVTINVNCDYSTSVSNHIWLIYSSLNHSGPIFKVAKIIRFKLNSLPCESCVRARHVRSQTSWVLFVGRKWPSTSKKTAMVSDWS